MARDGIPIPAQPDGARVDYFGPVLADIGDLQSVDDDLSTFSGHMVRAYTKCNTFIGVVHIDFDINIIPILEI
jgi:dsDNA-specific endonuclease/ATPase MutS2